MTVIPADLQSTFDQVSQPQPNAPGSGAVGGAPNSTQPAAEPSASDQVGNLPLTPRPGGVSPSIGEQVAANLNNFPVTSSPGAWAKSLIASTMDTLAKRGAQKSGAAGAVQGVLGGVSSALAAAGNVGTVPAGGGVLYGMSKAAQYLNEQKQQQAKTANDLAQQTIANDRDQQRLELEKQNAQNNTDRTAAEIARSKQEIASGNVAAHHAAILMRNEDAAEVRAQADFATRQAEPFLQEGSQVLYRDIDSSTLQEKLKAGELNSARNIVFQSGHSPALDATGKPILDEDGEPMVRQTYMVLSPPKDVTLNQANADLLNEYGIGDNAGQKWIPGTVIPASLGYYQIKQAQQARSVLLQAEDRAAEIQDRKAQTRERNEDAATKAAKLSAANTIAPYLSNYNNDPVLAFNAMSNAPADKNKMNAWSLAGYTPVVIEKMKKDGLQEASKTIADAPTKIAKLDDDIEKRQDDKVATVVLNGIAYQAKKGKVVVGTDGKPVPLTPDQIQKNSQADADVQNYQDQKKQISDIAVTAATRKRNQYLGLAPTEDPRVVDNFLTLQNMTPAQQEQSIMTSKMPTAAKLHMFILLRIPPPPALQAQLKPRQAPQAQPQAAQTQPQTQPSNQPAQ